MEEEEWSGLDSFSFIKEIQLPSLSRGLSMNSAGGGRPPGSIQTCQQTEQINTKLFCPPTGSRLKAYLVPPSHRKNGLNKL